MKFSKLSLKAKRIAVIDYMDGWNETHPNDKLSYLECISLIKDTENEIDYNKDGTIKEGV